MPKIKAARWGAEDGFGAYDAKAEVRRKRGFKENLDGKKARVIDRSGSAAHLERAAKALGAQAADKRTLSAPQHHMALAIKAMKRAGVSGVVSNLCGSKKVRVRG